MSDAPGLRAAVIGLGRMGMHHVRACHDTPGIELVAILDHKPDWAVEVGADTQSLVAADLESLFGKVDCAIIAVPTRDHAATAIPLLQNGISCLVEKPIAASAADAEAMIAASNESGSILQIGHIERFNPVLVALFNELDAGMSIRRLDARRHNPPQDRAYDVDAVLDLMIHDIDLMLDLTSEDIKNISVAEGANSETVRAHLTCGDTTEVVMSVTREADTPERSLCVEFESGSLHADLLEQKLVRRLSVSEENIPVTSGDALRSQLLAFAAAVQSGTCSGASGPEGLAALRLANRIRTAVELT